MTISTLFIFTLLPLIVLAKESSGYPQDGYILETTKPTYAMGMEGSQFTNHIHRGAKITALGEGTVPPKAEFGAIAGDYIRFRCQHGSNNFCWIKQEVFLPANTAERAAVLKNNINNFENQTSKKSKGKSISKKGDLAFVLHKDNGYCQIRPKLKIFEWVSCSDLAFDKDSVDAALNLERIKLYSKYDEGYNKALQIILKMKDEPKKPFSSLAASQEKAITKKIDAYEKMTADPNYQACSGDGFEDPEN